MNADFIKATFGINCTIEKTKVKGLALYMTDGREFYMVNMDGLSFLLVKISGKDRFGAIALEKQLSLFTKVMNCEVAYFFESMTKLQRDSLIARRIPFISGTDQIYLPFLGIVLRNNLRAGNDTPSGKMMPATQCLFLYLLYHNQQYVLKKQAAEELGLTRTSITRASEQLKGMELITEEVCGKEIHMKTSLSGYELYQKAKTYLITPVSRRIYVDRADVHGEKMLAGESALSRESMLGAPKYETFAIYKKDDQIKDLNEVDIQWQENKDIVQIEIWKYNPLLFAADGMVDPVSLALSLSDNQDERVQGELESYMEDCKW